MIREGEKISRDEHRVHFPDFLWLVRDYSLVSKDLNGAVISLKEHVTTKLLPRVKCEGDDLNAALINLFPSFECMQIPTPGVDDPTMSRIDQLKSNFNESLEKSRMTILSQIKPRKVFEDCSKVDGILLSQLLRHHVEALNMPDALPNLELSWQSAIKYKVAQISASLQEAYEQEMRKELEDKLPIEEGSMDESPPPIQPTLFSIHLSIFNEKYAMFKDEVNKLLSGGISALNKLKQQLLQDFRNYIFIVDGEHITPGTKLYAFIEKNMQTSREQCSEVFDNEYNIQMKSEIDLKQLEASYLKKAIGPAKEYVLKSRMRVIPTAPLNLIESEKGCNHVAISWDNPTSDPQYITEYELVLAHAGQNDWKTVKLPKDTQKPAKVSDLAYNTLYDLRLRACNDRRKGEFSELLKVKTNAGKPEKPEKPDIQLSEDHPTKARIIAQRLSKEKQNGADIDKIAVGSSLETSNEWTWKDCVVIPGDEPIKTEIELPSTPMECKSIKYKIKMINIGGESEASEVVMLKTSELYPGEPQELSCLSNPEKREGIVSWSAPSINPSSASSYRLEYKKEHGTWIKHQVEDNDIVTRQMIPNLEPATLYHVRVRAKNYSHKGKWSEITITTGACKPNKPMKPLIKTDPVDHEKVIISVQRLPKNEENGSPVLNIIAEKCRGESKEWVSKAYPLSDINQMTEVKMDLDNATDLTTYYFRVRMENEIGLSEPSDVVELKTAELFPGPPDKLNCRSVPEKKEGIISWSAPSINPSSALSYQLKYKKGVSGDWKSCELDNDKKQVVINVEPATLYNIRVRALNSIHEGRWRKAEFITKAWKPNKPMKPTIETDPTNCLQVILSVQMLSKNEENGSTVSKIIVQRSTEDSKEWVELPEHETADGKQDMRIKTDLESATKDTTFYFRVAMRNDVGVSEPSDAVTIHSSKLYPGPPKSLDCSSCPEKAAAFVSWSAPTINPASVASYQLQYNMQGESGDWIKCQLDDASTKRTILNLERATQYCIRVRALNSSHQGKWKEKCLTIKPWKPNMPMKPTIEIDPEDYRKGILSIQLLKKSEENGSAVSTIIVESCKLAVPREWIPIEYPLSRSGEKEIIKVELENVTEETTYYYRVLMKNDAGSSEPSPECELKSSEMIPDHPCQFYAPKEMITSNNVTLVWNEPVHNPKSVHYYRIDTRQKETDNWVSHASAKSSYKSFRIEKLSPKTTFHFRVIAYNKFDKGYDIEKSPSITVTTRSHPPTKPDTSSMDIIVNSPTEATVTFKKPSSVGTSGNLTYLIIEMINEQSISYKKRDYAISVIDNDTITQEFELDNEIKFIRVTLKDETGTGEPSDIVGIDLSSIPPGPPQNLVTDLIKKANCLRILVKWSPPATQPRVVTGYCVQRQQSSNMGKRISGQWTTVKEEYTCSEHDNIKLFSAEISDLAPFSEYLFQVNAINGDKAGDYTEIVKCSTPALPPEKSQTPNLIPIDNQPDKIKVEIKKLEEEKENGSPVTKVIIEYSCDKQKWEVCEEIDIVSLKLHDKETNPQWIVQTRILNVTDESVNEIAYRVILKNGAGKSDPSDYSILDVRDLIPGPVVCLQPTLIKHHEIKFTWKEPNINPAIVTSYQVSLCKSSGKHMITSNIDKSQMAYEAHGLRSNRKYKFQIKALSSKSSGKTETIEFGTREFDPCPPANLRVHKVRKDAIKIRWDDHDGDAAETNREYKITIIPEIGPPITINKHGRGHTKVIPDLEPSTEYTIHVAGVNESKRESRPATIKVTTKMSTGKRALFTAMGSIAGGIPGIIAYKLTKGDAEEDFYSSGGEYNFDEDNDEN